MHGFLNLFGGAILVHVGALDAHELPALLADEQAGHFKLNGESLQWEAGLSASPEAIASARDALACSFGSCSFDEPREDLRALGIL